MSSWVRTMILQKTDLKERAVMLKNMIKLAFELLRLNNFNGAMEILSGLSSAPISRLKKTWDVSNFSFLVQLTFAGIK